MDTHCCNWQVSVREGRDAGVVDRAALEMRCTGNCTGGSNPSLSAKIKYFMVNARFHKFYEIGHHVIV